MGLSLPPSVPAHTCRPVVNVIMHRQCTCVTQAGWLPACLLYDPEACALPPPLLVWSHAGGIGLGMYRGGYCLAYLTNAEMKFEAMQRAPLPRHSRFPLTLVS